MGGDGDKAGIRMFYESRWPEQQLSVELAIKRRWHGGTRGGKRKESRVK